MIVKLKTQGLQTLEQVCDFLAGSTALDFVVEDREAAYGFIEDQLRRFGYLRLGRTDKGLVRGYLINVTGLSRAQVARLIGQFVGTGRIHDRRGPPAKRFARRYTAEDVRLLAEVDTLHDTLSGPATRKLCERALTIYGDTRFERLAAISNGQLYTLRHSSAYRQKRGSCTKTPSVQWAIGERRKPCPEERPGLIRIDSVHQGGLNGIKGLQHINLVDEVTQFQFVGCVERTSENFLIPVLEALIGRFPFDILGFHSDNGSEFINHRVTALLEKLRVGSFTKSRTR